MKLITREGGFTFEDFCLLVNDDQKAELIDGIIFEVPPDETDANALSVWLIRVLGDFIEWKGLGNLFIERVAFHLDDWNAVEPDLAFVAKDRRDLICTNYVDGPPDLALEIVSDDSREIDYVVKRKLYERMGVREYWIIDWIRAVVTQFRLTKKGKYRTRRCQEGVLASSVVSGFWMRPEWLWQNPLPSKFAILKEILPEIQ